MEDKAISSTKAVDGCWSLSRVQHFLTLWIAAHPASVHWVFQARILGWVAIPFSKGSSCPWDRAWVSRIKSRATREAPTHSNRAVKWKNNLKSKNTLRECWDKIKINDICISGDTEWEERGSGLKKWKMVENLPNLKSTNIQIQKVQKV